MNSAQHAEEQIVAMRVECIGTLDKEIATE